MNKTERRTPFPGTVQSRLPDKTLHTAKSDFSRLIRRGEGAEVQNLQPAHPWLRTHPKLSSVYLNEAVSAILGMRVYNGKLMLVAMQNGHLAFFVYRNGAFSKHFVTVEEYPIDFDLRSYMEEPLYTTDRSPRLSVGENAPKLLFFPIGKYMVLSDDLPQLTADMPPEILHFEHATISGGRVYASIGQQLYVSSSRNCFDWAEDENGVTDPRNGFHTPITSHTERQTPVTALINYQGSVLIFRENVIQKVVGAANPYTVTEVLQTGTTHTRSIRELNGQLYFIRDGAPVCFSGYSMRSLPALPEGYTATGCAAVYDGKYWFSAKKNGSWYLMHYDPASTSYGVMSVGSDCAEMAATADGLFYLGAGTQTSVKKLSDARADTQFSLEFPLFEKDLEPKAFREAALHCRIESGASLTVTLKQTDDAGSETRYTLAQATGGGKDVVLRMHGKRKATAFIRMNVSGTGDVTIKNLSAECVSAHQKKT